MLSTVEKSEFVALRKTIIEAMYRGLNAPQREAVMTTTGPLLLLAGAGSGKTTVLIERIANLIHFGEGSDSTEVPEGYGGTELQVLRDFVGGNQELGQQAVGLCAYNPAVPWSILAITFTNKAAGELKERLEKKLGACAYDVWASTFHSSCVRILRRDIDKLGFGKNFTIYDSADSTSVIKQCLKELELDPKHNPPSSFLREISKAKDSMMLAEDFAKAAEGAGYVEKLTAKIYKKYQKKLWDAKALDFDDIIFHTVRLLEMSEEVRSYYQKKFRYVLIDEYQDTNQLQYRLASLLAGGYENFCVVGDDDQSIYRFRGATIENILNFEQQYKGAKVIRLEENYRSTQTILEASNQVIGNNTNRKGKTLWTQAEQGEQLTLYRAQNEHEEAQYITSKMMESYGSGMKWRDHAILYRTNAQSLQMESACKRNGVPYRIVGGMRFFDRAEVKDMLAYLTVLENPDDDLRLLRIVNQPARGLGGKTIEMAQEIALREETCLFAILDNAELYPDLQRSVKKMGEFTKLIIELSMKVREMPLEEFYEVLLEKTGYVTMLETKKTEENQGRIENIREVLSSIHSYMENCDEENPPSLAGFLDEIALFTDLDTHDSSADYVTMMTMHSAKGLEFPVVFLPGMEEGIFPGFRSVGEEAAMEEERRLCYVGMTRAKKKLYLSCAVSRMLYGRTSSNPVSRFIAEIPEELLEKKSGVKQEVAARKPDKVSVADSIHTPQFSKGTKVATVGGVPRNVGKTAVNVESFVSGDKIIHKAFGNGEVKGITPMGNDAMLEIAFESGVTKRLMMKAAREFMKKG